MSADLCPTVCSFLEVVEEKVKNSVVEAALEVGKVQYIEGGVKRVAEKFQKRQKDLKKNK